MVVTKSADWFRENRKYRLGKILLSFLILILSACSGNTRVPPTPPVDKIINEEEKVYAFLLDRLYHNKGYVIMATTSTNAGGTEATSDTLDYILQNMHGVNSTTVTGFRERNDASHPLQSGMDLGHSYVLMTQADRNLIFGQNQSGWEIFYNRYPQAPGITSLSRVGFDSSLSQALVYIGTESNWLAGSGIYYLLVKSNGEWRIDQQVMAWIS